MAPPAIPKAKPPHPKPNILLGLLNQTLGLAFESLGAANVWVELLIEKLGAGFETVGVVADHPFFIICRLGAGYGCVGPVKAPASEFLRQENGR